MNYLHLRIIIKACFVKIFKEYYQRSNEERNMAIKYCVWDVGQVIYPYTLVYLNKWAFSKTTDKEGFQNKGGIKSFNYNPYMSGAINNEEFCKELCQQYHIPFDEKTELEIKEALHQGVGEFFEETKETMTFLAGQGIRNCILSNALPMLEDTAPDLIENEYRFASFNLKLLKPDPDIYKEVRRRLGCRFDEMIFVDDKPKNVNAAAELGIHGIVFNKDTIKNDCENILRKTNCKINSKVNQR